MRGFTQQVPFFLPALAVVLFVALVLARTVARALSTRPWVAFLLLFSAGMVVAATLTPLQTALDGLITSRPTCDLRRIGLAPFSPRMLRDDSGLNILLFIPLGIALGLLPRSRRKAMLLCVAFASPIVIELTQLIARPLGRGCQSADVFDNLTGLVLGLLAGSVGAWLVRRRAS